MILPRSLAVLGAALLATSLLVGSAQATDTTHAFIGARILPISGDPIEEGTLVIENGRIVAVGPSASVRIPGDAEKHDVHGKVIMPGLVDTHSHVGGPAGGDKSSPIQPECRVMDSFDVRDAGIQKAQAGGLTTANIMSGSGHLISGQTIYVKFRDGRTIDGLLLRDKDGQPLGGLKMANGTNSQDDPPFPGTRSKSAALVRAQYVKAQEYRDKIKRAKKDKDRPDRDLGLDALVEAMDGKRVVHQHTHRADDIITALRLQKEFGYRIVLHHVSEAWKVADEIAAAKAPCSIILIDSPGGKLEAMEMDWKTGGILEKAGVKVAIHTDDGITDSRLFLRSAGLAVRGGNSREGALRALTLAGAEMLDLEDRIGSLEKGKDADFIILTGDPLSVYTMVQETWVDGVRVFDRNDPKDRLYAVGGWGASRPQSFVWCCFEEGGPQ